MPEKQLSRMRIKKTGEDHYHVLVKDEFADIDEDVDGSQLMAMLGKERLVGTTAAELLSDLDAHDEIGYELLVIYKRRTVA